MYRHSVRFILLFGLLVVLLSGCNVIAYFQQDPFYRNSGGWGPPQFPLIKPYSVSFLGGNFGWTMPMQASPATKDTYYYESVHDIRKIAVSKGVIMLYTPYQEPVEKSVGQKVLNWFAIIPAENIEEGFDNETEFLNYIKKYGIEQPAWKAPDTLNQQFSDTFCLDWIPACE